MSKLTNQRISSSTALTSFFESILQWLQSHLPVLCYSRYCPVNTQKKNQNTNQINQRCPICTNHALPHISCKDEPSQPQHANNWYHTILGKSPKTSQLGTATNLNFCHCLGITASPGAAAGALLPARVINLLPVARLLQLGQQLGSIRQTWCHVLPKAVILVH